MSSLKQMEEQTRSLSVEERELFLEVAQYSAIEPGLGARFA